MTTSNYLRLLPIETTIRNAKWWILIMTCLTLVGCCIYFTPFLLTMAAIMSLIISSIWISIALKNIVFAQKIAFYLFFIPTFLLFKKIDYPFFSLNGFAEVCQILGVYYFIFSFFLFLFRDRFLQAINQTSHKI